MEATKTLLSVDYANDLQQLFDSIEDKARTMQDNLGDKNNTDRGLSQIITIARIASKMIDPEAFENLQNHLKKTSNRD